MGRFQSQNKQEMKVIKISQNDLTLGTQDVSQMTFFNRQKTKLIHKNISDESQDVDNYHDTGDSKSATIETGQDRSATSHLNIKLPPTMGKKVGASIGEYIKDIIRVAPMELNDESVTKP